MSYYAILTVKSNRDHIIIYCGTNNLKTDDYPEVISEKTFELAKSIKSTTNEAAILSIISHRDELADKGCKVNNNVKHFCKETYWKRRHTPQ